MLKPTDLRIGNKLNYITSEGDVMETTIDWQALKWLTEDPKGFNVCHMPIEITTKRLTELGLKAKGNDFLFPNHFMKYYNCDVFIDIFIIARNVKYIHQIQNLYHTLTGKELCN